MGATTIDALQSQIKAWRLGDEQEPNQDHIAEIEAQRNIGWNQFIRSRLTVQIRGFLMKRLKQSEHKNLEQKAHNIIKAFIQSIWTCGLEIWK